VSTIDITGTYKVAGQEFSVFEKLTATDIVGDAMPDILQFADESREAREKAEMLKRTERAYLTVVEPPHPDLKDGEPIHCTIRVRNSGKTPAFVSFAGAVPDVRPVEIKPDDIRAAIKAAGKEMTAIIAPGDTMDVPQTNNVIMSHGMTDGKTGVLYILGRVIYKDVMDDEAELGFCFRRDAGTNTFSMYCDGNYIKYLRRQFNHGSAPP